MQLFVSSEFYIKNVFFCFFFFHNSIWLILSFIFFFFHFDKNLINRFNTIDLFNKWVVLGLRNFDSFNKLVELVLTHIIGYS